MADAARAGRGSARRRTGADDSGYVYVPWVVDGHGQYLLGTSTLIERDRPYLLDVELARGLVQRLRSRLFIWEWLGMKTPPELSERLQEATQALLAGGDQSSRMAAAAESANKSIALRR